MTTPTKKQCIALAKEAGLLGDRIANDYAAAVGIERGKHWLCEVTEDMILSALSLAYAAGAADENEACANVCDINSELYSVAIASLRDTYSKLPESAIESGKAVAAAECADAIRARKGKK